MDHSYDDQAEIGFLFMPAHFGTGYATEAVAAMLQYATTLRIQTIIARVTAGNGASARVLEKCGFILQRELINAICINHVFYSDLKYQWVASVTHGA